MLTRFKDVLRDTPGLTNELTLSINTGDSTPVRSHPYRIPPRWKEEVKSQIDLLLSLGIIQASDSPLVLCCGDSQKEGWWGQDLCRLQRC